MAHCCIYPIAFGEQLKKLSAAAGKWCGHSPQFKKKDRTWCMRILASVSKVGAVSAPTRCRIQK
jgi:hypothetical protein